jgi:transcriptional regulator with XRE-family HTH domain
MAYRICTRITEEARERGWTAAEIARKLKLYRSNLSSADAGKRSVSLGALARIAAYLGLSPGDLIEMNPAGKGSYLFSPRLSAALHRRSLETPDGSERGWTHKSLLAWQRHFKLARHIQ